MALDEIAENEKIKSLVDIYHKGAYACIYRYAMENGYQITGLHRQCYIDGIWNKENAEDWMTEIQLPVK